MVNVSISNGKEVEQLVVGIYLNVCTSSSNEASFIDEMLKQEEGVINNFIFLCLEWLRKLSSVVFWDERNEASVQLAERIYSRTVQTPSLKIYDQTEVQHMEVDTSSVKEVGDAMVTYLKNDSRNEYREFLLALLNEHRTLQQTFTRVVFRWLQRACINRANLSWLCDIDCYLPYI